MAGLERGRAAARRHAGSGRRSPRCGTCGIAPPADGLESVLRVDFGEVRGFAYYTGAIFTCSPTGRVSPSARAGATTTCSARFGAPMPAAGFALDLDNLAWALRVRGREEALEPRVLVALEGSVRRAALHGPAGRGRWACAGRPGERNPEAYARAWGFSHVLGLPRATVGLELVEPSHAGL